MRKTVLLEPEQATQRTVSVAQTKQQKADTTTAPASSSSTAAAQPASGPTAEGGLLSLYLPLLAGGETAATAQPILKEDGVDFYQLWDIQSLLDGAAYDGGSHRATLIFSAQPLLAQGLDPHLMNVWTRQAADGQCVGSAMVTSGICAKWLIH